MYIGSIVNLFTSMLFRVMACNRAKRKNVVALNSAFYVERMTTRGDVITEYVEAKALSVVDGQIYLYGWCEMVPSYRCMPVQRIVKIADDATGEIVLRDDVAEGLINRAMH